MDVDSSEASPSDLELAVSNISRTIGLIGYRNVLSYTSALGIRILPSSTLDTSLWTKIGFGTFSTTYKGVLNLGSSRPVAIKQPNRSFNRADADLESSVQHEGLRSIIQELRILTHAKLRDHPNLPHVLGVFFQQDGPNSIRPCVVFDLATTDLKRYFAASGPGEADPRTLTKLAIDVADGIAALHAYNIVHGDIKPDNILLFMRNDLLRATVADLGTSGITATVSGVINGTRWYCAPEYNRQSPFARHVNEPPRDVYNFGLVLWSIMTRCRGTPFPHENQFIIQHDDTVAFRLLMDQVASEDFISIFSELMQECLKCDPRDRPSIFDVSSKLGSESNDGCGSRNVTDVVEETMIENPTVARIKALSEMSLPAHLIGKLRHEYKNALNESDAIRSAITLAGLYSGAIGASIEAPWNTVAKIQWLSKAIELGSYASVQSLMMDKDTLRCIEEFGKSLLKVRRGEFASPLIDLDVFYHQLKQFAEMPDKEAASLCVFFGGSLDWDLLQQRLKASQSPGHSVNDANSSHEPEDDSDIMDEDDNQALSERNVLVGDKTEDEDDRPNNEGNVSDGGEEVGDTDILGDEATTAIGGINLDTDEFAGLKDLAQFTPNRRADLEIVDSDAYDSIYVRASPIAQSNFNNQLETFIRLATENGMNFRDEQAGDQMAQAIFHGSLDIVRYLVLQYGVQPNDEWQGMSNFNCAILFRRTAILEFFLQQGAILEAARGDQPSALHLISRHENPELVRMLCERLRMENRIAEVLESTATHGGFKDWTAAYTAMVCQSWRNFEVLLEYGADPNGTIPEGESNLIELAVIPRSPATPRFVLQTLLRRGVALEDGYQYDGSALSWAIRSSNVFAVYDLLQYGATVSDAAIRDAEEDIIENEKRMNDGKYLPVVDEDGQTCDQGWDNMMSAARLVKELLLAAQRQQPSQTGNPDAFLGSESDWKDRLAKKMHSADERCLGKIWISNSRKVTYLIEVQILD